VSDAGLTVDLAEFDRLRTEIDNRTTLGSNVVALELTAAGAAIAVADKIPDALLGLAAVTCCLWLLWLDHAVQVYKLASYIGVQLAPKLTHDAGRRVLGWESYLRTLDAGGPAAWQALYPAGQPPGRDDTELVTGTRSVASYVTVLFGGIPFVTAAIYVAVVVDRFESTSELVRLIGVAVVAGLWLVSVMRYLEFRRGAAHIVHALLEAGRRADDAEREGASGSVRSR
jgi:hypothetical protein